MKDNLQPNVIHILGASGAGKIRRGENPARGKSGAGTSTLGQALSRLYGYTQLDTDDYFWMPTDPKFTVKRELTERQKMMEADLINCQKCVIRALCAVGVICLSRVSIW